MVAGMQEKTSRAMVLLRIKQKQRKRVVSRPPDQEKEAVFRLLAGALTGAGYQVRREKLKQGHGWKAASGSCRSFGDRLVFVERRMSQDDQIEFLISAIQDLKLSMEDDQFKTLPESVRLRLAACAA
jgi:hypothetical protein